MNNSCWLPNPDNHNELIHPDGDRIEIRDGCLLVGRKIGNFNYYTAISLHVLRNFIDGYPLK